MTEQKAGSILAQMSQGVRAIAQDKAAQAQGLTPVGVEPRPVIPGATFPNDMPHEVMEEAARDIERTIEHLSFALAAIRNRQNTVVTEVVLPKVNKADERFEGKDPEPEPEPDIALANPGPPVREGAEEFAAQYEAQSKAAQAATFNQPPDVGNMPPVEWTCPTHGGAGAELKSPAGRTYFGCPVEGCKQWKKENA